jgi:type I restriction enzyme S subunit
VSRSVVGDLPTEWRATPLKYLASSSGGMTPSKDRPDFWNGNVPWVSPKDMKKAVLADSIDHVSQIALEETGLKLHPPEGVMVVVRGMILAHTFPVARNSVPVTVNQDMKVLRPVQGVDSRYLAWMLQGLEPVMLSLTDESAHGTKALRTDQWANLAVPVPSPSAQERIASFLDEQTARIDALIAEKKELLSSLREHQYSHVSHLMTRGLNATKRLKPTSHPEVGDIPEHWTVKRLKFLGEVRSGIAKGKDHGEKEVVSLPYLRVANVQDGYVDLAEVLEIDVGANEVDRYLLKLGDVLMNEGGDNDKLGRGTVWEAQIDPCVHQNHVFAVRLFDTGLAEWVARFTSTDAARAYFFLRSKQSTNLASINQSNVRELPVPMPPPNERSQILAEVRRSTAAAADLTAHAIEHIDRLREYRSSLISAAVTGQLDIGAFKAKAA